MANIAYPKNILILLLILSFSVTAFAGVDPPVFATLKGTQIYVGASMTVEDSKFFDSTYDNRLIKPYPVHNKITFKVNEIDPLHLRNDFTATVSLKITWTDSNENVNITNKSLTVDFNDDGNHTYSPQNAYEFTGGYRVVVEITQVNLSQNWGVASVLILVNELQSYPVYDFSCTRDSIATVNHTALPADTDSDELSVSWVHRIGVDEYDLEWTYLDSTALASGRYDSTQASGADKIFNHNASRVTITGNSFKIPLIYDNTGTLFYRVRPVVIAKNNLRFEGKWSTYYGLQGLGRFNFKGHQRNLNWQATTSFAEDGKRKTVVQYFDGSLRSRQSVSKDNTTDTTIIAESFYDFQGRPVIQVLPAPSLSNIIKYTQNFNTGINSNEYDKQDFDVLLDSSQYCSVAAPAMDTLSGTSRYYSSNNPDKEKGYHKYIPDAKGYPFTEVEYVQDNTGRISRQGGVGEKYRLSSGHETKYYYGTPDQDELDALFGTEVGDRSHYFKTMVRDANGQYSVSYTDMHGRTIATALAGTPPDSIRLDTLASNVKATRTETLSDPNAAIIRGLVMESKKGLLVARAGNHTFNYTLNPDSLKIEGCDASKICYDCLYDLQITITDDCNNQKLPGGKAFDTVVRNFPMGSFDTVSNTPAGFQFSFVKYLPEGSYEITKKLSVSREAINYYRDSIFLATNTCRSIDSFINEQRQIFLANAQCEATCTACIDSLGSWESFKLKFKTNAGITDDDTAMAWQAYKMAKADCDELCAPTSELVDIRKAMLLDLTPPSGQYANMDSLADHFSIFFTSINENGQDTTAKYQSITNYLNEDGKSDLVYDEGAGKLVKPQDLSPEAFAQKFKLSWAEALLPSHPEYCKLQQYEALSLSHGWDRRFAAVDTYLGAMAKGYLNPTQNNASAYTRFNATSSADYDPLRDNNYTMYGFKALLEQKMDAYYTHANGTISIWNMATLAIKCKDGTAACYSIYDDHANAFNTDSMCTADLDMAWRTYRQMYLEIKRDLIYARINSQCPSAVSTSTLVAANHQPHFSNANEMLQLYDAVLPNDKIQAEAHVQGDINNYYDANCRAYAEHWMESLSKCAQYPIDSINNVIIPQLIQICKEGADAGHPYGSSSVRPASTNAQRNFQQVIDEYNQSHGITDSLRCHAYSITAPKPYDQQLPYGNKPLYTKPDSCECATINQQYQKYTLSGDTSFSTYMARVYQTIISDSVLTVLRSACNDTASNCNFLENPIQLPPVLQCYTGDVCADCAEISSMYTDFRNKYPGIEPVRTPVDSSQELKNKLFGDFMNARLGFNKEARVYINFIDSCGITGTTSCDTLNNILSYYNTNVKPGKVIHTFLTQEGEDFQGPHDIFFDGVAHFPDSIRQRQRTWYNGYQFDVLAGYKFDMAAGYTIETKIRYDNADAGSNTFFLEYRSIGAVFQRQVSGLYLTQVVLNGYSGLPVDSVEYLGYGVGFNNILVDANPNAVFSWMTFKAIVTPSLYRLYYNGQLIFQRYRNPSLPIGFSGTNGTVDWVKVGNVNGITKYFEDFNDPDHLAFVNPDFLYPYPGTCESSFRNFFNLARGTNYSFHQIDSLYRQNCGTFSLNICGSQIDSSGAAMQTVEDYRDSLPNGNCSAGFAAFYNQRFNTAYTYQQLDSIYWNFYDMELDICEGNTLQTELRGIKSDFKLLTVSHGCDSYFRDFFNQARQSNLSYFQISDLYASNHITLDVCGPSFLRTDLTLCGRSEPVFKQTSLEAINNCSDSTFFAVSVGTELYKAYTDSVKNTFDSAYRAKCLQAYKKEKFTVTHEVSEYHYTLYYYDQAGNLVKTIAPEGVAAKYDSLWLDSVVVARAAKQVKVPAHKMPTQYRYNTLNQVVAQKSPDGGLSRFWYERLGRLAISQDAKQFYSSGTETNKLYSYTLYDSLGRITEVGEIKNATTTVMTDSISRNPGLLAGWLQNSATNKSQITTTVYDEAYPAFVGIIPTIIHQRNLRNRVSYTSLTNGNSIASYNSATFYSYDIHGNVDTLVQDYGSSSDPLTVNMMNSNGNQYKKLVYHYDLISGKVNMMQYQPGYTDMFIHRYSYDAENRLIEVETSKDSILWQKDARYQYYKHGPLARVVIGDQMVQGLDYSYTLQGWLKGVNSTALNVNHDMGGDGNAASNQYIPRDVFAQTLNYYNGDYFRINQAYNPFPNHWSNVPDSSKRPLYNGNISSMATSILRFSNPIFFGGGTMLYHYRYDQLNRLTGMDALRGFNDTTNSWSNLTPVQQYKERVRYDANGNILKYTRNGHKNSLLEMDNLTYHYYTGTNRLKYIGETVSKNNYTGADLDLENHWSTENYRYDSIGNIIVDAIDGISAIKWNVYGKILEINKASSGSLPATKISYSYDAQGNRIGEVVERSTQPIREYTWYVRDAQGNMLAQYKAYGTTTGSLSTLTPYLFSQGIYGSSRLGAHMQSVNVDGGPQPLSLFEKFSYNRGQRLYEFSNHLGNVMAVVTDRKWGTPSAGPGSPISYYTADLFSATDYFPFGMRMPGRNNTTYSAHYAFGFNGKENDDDVEGVGNQQDYGMRIYDPRVGRFLSVDPISRSYPELTPYQFASNRPVDGIDLDGREWTTTGKYFSSPEGKFRIDYTMIVSLSAKGNQITVANNQDFLMKIKESTNKILSKPGEGSKEDPIINVNIAFTDKLGEYKASFRTFTSISEYDPATGNSVHKGDIGSVGGITEKLGNSQQNFIDISIGEQMVMMEKNKPASRIPGRVSYRTENEIARSFAHEIGHTLGLFHPWDAANDTEDAQQGLGPVYNTKVFNNLMNSRGNIAPSLQNEKGTELSKDQRKKIEKTVSSQQPQNKTNENQ